VQAASRGVVSHGPGVDTHRAAEAVAHELPGAHEAPDLVRVQRERRRGVVDRHQGRELVGGAHGARTVSRAVRSATTRRGE